VDNNTFEVYCLAWFHGYWSAPSAETISENACYTDRARAEAHLEKANKARKLFHKCTGAKWFIKTLTVKHGPKEVSNGRV